MDKIRIFIGSSANGEDKVAEMAYEYSIRKNTSRDVEIVWMRQTKDKDSFWSQFDTSSWATPFSGFRWGIPEYCNFEGRAIYTDADMLNFCDMGELFDLDMGDNWVLARPGVRFGREMCVMLLDCSKFKNVEFPSKSKPKYHGKVYNWLANGAGKKLVGDLDPAWNSLDGETMPFKQLHYTNMRTQPWHPTWFNGKHAPHAIPELERLFWDTVKEAHEAGYHEDDYDPKLEEGFEEIPFTSIQRRY